ncbi:MAG: hypothetical protein GY864_05940 [Desulfobacterales bacterium]|nr:hypothetical protein [Desulfobacterales bacterium]
MNKESDKRNSKALIKTLLSLSGQDILDWILELDDPEKTIQDLSHGDFFWLIKNIGDDDCLPALEFASTDQWQYLLDLEIWEKDRLHTGNTSLWLKRLEQANSKRLAEWLFDQGQALAYIHFYKNIEVFIREDDEDCSPPQGFFTLDGVFYIRCIYPAHQESIANILRQMAAKDLEQYKTFLSNLAGVLPAEVEEQMYRLKNVRLAEHGFLPFEEALSIYAFLDPGALAKGNITELPLIDKDIQAMAPVSPLYHVGADNILALAVSGISDPILLDRIRLEFAGLCNQVISADKLQVHEPGVLIKVCRKTAGYLALALEKLCDKDIDSAEQLLKGNTLASIFRVGFGLALKLKWEAEHWLKKSLFHRMGLDHGFWDKPRGNILAGLLKERPRFYTGIEEGQEYKDFETPSEPDKCKKALRQLIVLDRLLETLAGLYPMDKLLLESDNPTFQPFLFNMWARNILKLAPGFSGISQARAKDFFQKLRGDTRTPPYKMPGFKARFITDMTAHTPDFGPEDMEILKHTLALVWQEFREEYEWLSIDDLNSRYSRFISITPQPG